MGDSRYRYGCSQQQQQHHGQYRNNNNNPYQGRPLAPLLQTPTPTVDHQQQINNNGTTTPAPTKPTTNNMSEDTISKIVELKRGMWRHPNVFSNPDEVIQYVKYFCLNGDNKFLDERLEQLRMFEAATDKAR